MLLLINGLPDRRHAERHYVVANLYGDFLKIARIAVNTLSAHYWCLICRSGCNKSSCRYAVGAGTRGNPGGANHYAVRDANRRTGTERPPGGRHAGLFGRLILRQQREAGCKSTSTKLATFCAPGRQIAAGWLWQSKTILPW